MSENSALRTLLHFVAEDLKVADERKERNPVQLTTDIRNAIAIRDRRIAELEKESNDFDTEMAIVAKALTAAFEDGRLNANDKRNEQLSDIAESKKWQTEQVDTLRERIAELEAALKYVKDTITHDANGYDAADCIDNAMAGKACALDALLAKARREEDRGCGCDGERLSLTRQELRVVVARVLLEAMDSNLDGIEQRQYMSDLADAYERGEREVPSE